MINLIVDYLNNGAWMHQALQMFGMCDEQTAALAAVAQVRSFGCVPLAVHCIYGRYTLDELTNLEDGDAPHRLVWRDFKRLEEELRAERGAAHE